MSGPTGREAVFDHVLDDIVERLNEALRNDPDAIASLVFHRVPCNAELAEHATVQVGTTDEGWDVGLLGVLNGALGILPDGRGYLTAIVDVHKRTVTRFERTTP